MKNGKLSLKISLMTTIVICWLVPIIMVMTMAGVLLENNYRRSQQQQIDASVNNAMKQIQMRLQDASDSSKAVSYDGVIRRAYREYLQSGSPMLLYRTAKDYLNQNFSRNNSCQAVFLTFWQEGIAQPYVSVGGTPGHQITQALQNHTEQILQIMGTEDTRIRFLYLEGELYLARNLLDSSFTPYASLVMMLDMPQIFGSLKAFCAVDSVKVSLDDCRFRVDARGEILLPEDTQENGSSLVFSTDIDEYDLTVTVATEEYDLWADNPQLLWEIAGLALLVLPLLIVVIALFTYHVARPIQILAEANQQVQAGQRGYQIHQDSPNREFEKLYSNFNAMSGELRKQFERSFLEQQATQQAQIKALQSQINPHFLNNTLEIINWEARLAENDRVSAMIEALSVMLDAALGRDGRSQIPLQQELIYVDAYLYIIRERLGDSFHVHKQIDERLLEQSIPRLILQPIVENAVEHDITARRGGNLWVRASGQDGHLHLEVEHDGTMTEADQENIRSLLQEEDTGNSRLGLRNVHQRLKLIYGSAASLEVTQTENQTILARIRFPMV